MRTTGAGKVFAGVRFIALNMLAARGTRKFQINHNSSLPFFWFKVNF
jgi:hypothetical protein